jgi:mannosyltransferase
LNELTSRRWRAALTFALPALFSFSVCTADAGVPSYWNDEVATLRASRLPLPELFEFLGTKDAVHGLFYLIAHSWVDLVGEGETATRALSALAAAVGTVGVLVLARMMNTTDRGSLMPLGAAFVFALLPRTTYVGGEFRSQAIVAALAIWSAVALVFAASRSRRRWWVLYAVVSVVSVNMFVYSALLVAAHGVYLLVRRQSVARWRIAAGATAVTCIPMVLIALPQRSQVAWLANGPGVNPWTVLYEPYAATSWGTAAVVTAILVAGYARSRSAPLDATVQLCLACIALPTLLLVLAHLLAGPLFSSHYLGFVSPFTAILVASAVTALSRKRWVSIIAVTALAASSLPTYVTQRTPTAKPGSVDLRSLAAEIHDRSTAGDAFVLENDGPVVSSPRLALYAYPGDFAGLDDSALQLSFPASHTFSDVTYRGSALRERLSNESRIWVAVRPHSSAVEEIVDGWGAVPAASGDGWVLYEVVPRQ